MTTPSTDALPAAGQPFANPLPRRLSRRIVVPALLALTLLALAVNAWGIPKNLPYFHEVDEQHKVERAVRMATTGNLNPEWFGHPGSTVLYPMAAAYRLIFGPDSQSRYEQAFWPFSVVGRAITVLYAALAIPLIFLVGRKSFGDVPGLIGAFLYLFYLVAVVHAQIIRTDSAAVVFGLLSLWRILEVDERPAVGNQLLAGLAIGLGISSRYFMASLGLPLLMVNVLWWLRAPERRRALWFPALAGLAMIPLGFALTTPYFFLDWEGAQTSLRIEGRTVHPGADGLTRPQNFLWYLTTAIPENITWPQYILAIAGAVVVLARRTSASTRRRELLVMSYVPIFLFTVSLSALHWARWLIPILPILALLVGVALEWAAGRFFVSRRAQTAFLVTAVLAVSAWPIVQVVLHDIRESKPGTRVLAREWMIANLPPGSRMALDPYTPPLADAGFDITESSGLARLMTLEEFRAQGYTYLVASSDAYQRFFDEPERYPELRAFYEQLFAEGILVQEFRPTATLGGPVIRIYRIDGGG